jgi:hypothetical protein
VRCTFLCHACNFDAPLDHLDVDGAVECIACGVRQRFEVEGWRGALEAADAVGDLAGPDPEGRTPHPTVWIGNDNPYADIGATRTFHAHTESSGGLGTLLQTLHLSAAPGEPACRRCRVPLEVTLRAPGDVATRCPGCGDAATYATPPDARGVTSSLLGVIADEHRTDRPRARESAAGAVQSLSCPGCGGPLTLEGRDRAVVCPFCKAPCLVPARAVARATSGAPAPRLWWMLFRGPSPLRQSLESGDGFAGKVAAAAAPGGGGAGVGGFMGPAGKRRPPPVGEKPGVYEAAMVEGVDVPQLLLNAVLGGVALIIAYVVLGR